MNNPYKLMKIDVGNRDIHLPLNKLKLPTETKSMLLAMNCSESKKKMQSFSHCTCKENTKYIESIILNKKRSLSFSIQYVITKSFIYL